MPRPRHAWRENQTLSKDVLIRRYQNSQETLEQFRKDRVRLYTQYDLVAKSLEHKDFANFDPDTAHPTGDSAYYYYRERQMQLFDQISEIMDTINAEKEYQSGIAYELMLRFNVDVDDLHAPFPWQ